MKRTIRIEIDCGDKACASELGKRCAFFGLRHGAEPVCTGFPTNENGYYTYLDVSDGMAQRSIACLSAEIERDPDPTIEVDREKLGLPDGPCTLPYEKNHCRCTMVHADRDPDPTIEVDRAAIGLPPRS